MRLNSRFVPLCPELGPTRPVPLMETIPLTFLVQFVQSLANPYYLNHLASQKLLAQPAFAAYLAYLQYWNRPPYVKYLTYPGPTLRHLELLQQEKFRQDIMSPDLVQRLVEDEMKAAVEWHREA